MKSTKRGSLSAQHERSVEEARILQVLTGDGSMEHHDHKERSSVISARRWKYVSLALLVALTIAVSWLLSRPSTSSHHSLFTTASSQNDCQLSFGTYQGQEYKNSKETVGASTCLLESKWMRVMQHSVKVEGQTDIIASWLWIDYHDRINVLVEDERQPGQDEHRFLVFEQSKYALNGQTSLAVVGGIVEPHEHAQDAARREVQEEMNGMECKKFVPLGKYRTDVNRGMGWVHSFLATDCSRALLHDDGPASDGRLAPEVGASDIETQTLKSMSLQELRWAAAHGKFVEVQWSNTVMLALLHLESATDD